MAKTERVSRAGRPPLPRGKAALDEAVALAEEIDAAGGLAVLERDDPRRRAFALVVLRVAGGERLPRGGRPIWTSGRDATRFERAALTVFTEMLRRRQLRAAVERVRAAQAETPDGRAA